MPFAAIGFRAKSAASLAAACKRRTACAPDGATNAVSGRAGLWAIERRKRLLPLSKTSWRCAAFVLTAFSAHSTGRSNRSGSRGVSRMTTAGARCGDHSAGLCRTSALGNVGKAQPPPPGQTLPFGYPVGGIGFGPGFGLLIICDVVGVALQELLRKIRIVMIPVPISGRWRPP